MTHCNSYLLRGVLHVPGVGDIPVPEVLKAYSRDEVQEYLRGRVSRTELAAGYKRRMFFRHIEPDDVNYREAVKFWYQVINLRDRQRLTPDELYDRFVEYIGSHEDHNDVNRKEI